MTKAKVKRRVRDKRSRVNLPPEPWDYGAEGPANRASLVIEDVGAFDYATGETINPNRVRRARRVDMLEKWHRDGKLSTRAFNAGERLRNAFEETGRSAGWPDNDRVQSSPKPDHAVTIQIDRISRFHSIARHVPLADRFIVGVLVLRFSTCADAGLTGGRKHNESLRALNAALERLADAIS